MKDFPVIVDPFQAPSTKVQPVPVDALADEATSVPDVETPDGYTAWDYFIDHVDEFAVAKCICDHFDARPEDLHRKEVEIDAFALYLRAKLTLKRQSIAYATAQSALEKARQESRTVRSAFKRFTRHWLDVGQYLLLNPQGIGTLALAAVLYYLVAH